MTSEEAKAKISLIIRKTVELETEYVLDERYIRWGKIERELKAIIDELET